MFSYDEEHVVNMEDITVLSRLPRWLGRTTKAFSVLDHSVIASQLAAKHDPEMADVARGLLLHDMNEVFLLGDLPTIRKREFCTSNFRALEKHVKHAIYQHFNIPPSAESHIKYWDTVMLAAEWETIATVPKDEVIDDALKTAYPHHLKTAKNWIILNKPAANLRHMRVELLGE